MLLLKASYQYCLDVKLIVRCASIFITLSILGSAKPRYQVTSKEEDTQNADREGWQYSTEGLSKSMSKSRYIKVFGVDLSPDNVAVAIVYFVQGVLGLSRLAVSFYLKDNLHLEPAEVWWKSLFLHPNTSPFPLSISKHVCFCFAGA